MNRQPNALLIALLVSLFLTALPGFLAAQEYSDRGADNCLACHKADRWGVMPIFNTAHGSRVDADTPLAGLQCEACHGPSREHAKSKDRKKVKAQRTFGDDDRATVGEQNEVCLGCHRDHAGNGWFGSAHEGADVGCVSCHEIHRDRDPVFDPLEQQQICFRCHQPVRSDTYKASGHPLRFGSMACSDCHDVHDGNNDMLLAQDNVNDTCYRCHAEKRGPFLWEHAPVTESCTLCHRPHGSNHPASLTRRPTLLCQQCHSATGHPGEAYTSEDMDGTASARFMLARGCMNCHTQVHGSNHPSGSSQLR